MNSKIKQLRELVRSEIKRALQEEDEQSQEQKAAAAKLLQAKRDKAMADMKAAQTQLEKAKK